MPGADKCLGIIDDSHGQGQVAPGGDLVYVKPDSLEKRKEFLPLDFTSV